MWETKYFGIRERKSLSSLTAEMCYFSEVPECEWARGRAACVIFGAQTIDLKAMLAHPLGIQVLEYPARFKAYKDCRAQRTQPRYAAAYEY